ncbi:FAD-dependent monooxygenase [Caballeronia sp. 15715]|uniref:FAD-dependent monooxygenase n=1 Tax=unclassified Caballeronia TaxID=2646786 RepID=UPI0039E539F4
MLNAATDILIVGAGPVGLLLATELRRDGIDVCLIDRMPTRTFYCRALGVTPRTIEIFEDIGIAQRAIEAGVWLTGVQTWQDGVPVPARSMSVPTQGLPYGSLSLAQFETERLLEAALAAQSGRVEYGVELIAFEEHDGAVHAQLIDSQGQAHTMRCRWLVGCDGSRSKVRSTLGLPFEGGQYSQTFALADLDVEWDLPRGPMYRFDWSAGTRPKASLAAVPVRGSARRYRLSIIVPEENAAALANTPSPDFDTMRALLLPALPDGTQLSSMRWSSVYRVSHRIVPAYSQGRVFVAGDAAHIHPPVGGQGMNTGLQDAHNLAWKLSLAAKDLAQPDLLASYSEERHPVGVDVVQSTSAALNAVFAREALTPAMRETQLLVTYRGSRIVSDECPDIDASSPAPGDRVPELGSLQQTYIGHARRLHDFVGGGRHILLGYIDAPGAQYDAFVGGCSALDAVPHELTSAVLIAAPGCEVPSNEQITVLTDAANEFTTAFHAPGGTVWGVRPDGHIGWRSHRCSKDAVKRWLQHSIQPE